MNTVEEPLLSIVTVTRNCVSTILDTLNSVAAHKPDSIEYIVVDGLSSDGTLDIIRDHTAVDQFVSEPDDGIYDAMNKGVSLARGKYVLFLNGDDHLIPGDFAEVLSTLRNSRTMIYCAGCEVHEAGSGVLRLMPVPWKLAFFNSIPHPSAFVPRTMLVQHPFRTTFRIAADYDFFLGAFLRRERFEILSFVSAVHYRGGASGDVKRSIQEVREIRKSRLGGFYPLAELFLSTYRFMKSALRRVAGR